MTETPPGWEGLLADDEHILWQGRAGHGVIWRDLASFQTVFGILFAAFAFFFLSFSSGMFRGANAPGGFGLMFTLVPMFFIAVGLYTAIGRLFWDSYLRGTTHYTLTDKAAFIASAPFGRRKLDRYPLREMKRITLDDDTPGSVWFGEKISVHRGQHGRTSVSVTPIGFRRIDDHREVFSLLNEARRKEGIE